MPSKSTKDSNAPRKPLSAYMLFSADERPKLKASGLDNFIEMSKALGAAWKQADLKTKAHYEKEHQQEKVRYENELKEYEKSGEPAPSSKSAQKNHPPSNSKTTKPVAKTSKKDTTAVKNEKHKSDDDDNDEEDVDEDKDEGESEEKEEEEEEEETPAPPVKNSRKKN
ncbi:unnamed protein product [Rotaria sp. Silwood1]|nr:unnamed protein product [Rotaria sp. Silwood1]CAF1195722.1 unnamed protein product [Rotaria sp. Silwood1]CAF3456431.1 unnamed protein product [Rotaria sp. Silwood1]CAF4838540.1 unnamed protein product [Rotaria sp. Silwood1]